MKQFIFSFLVISLLSCETAQRAASATYTQGVETDTLIVQSLFTDKASTITEEGIQKILDGSFKLPPQLRVAIVKLESPQQRRYWWSDEEYLKTQQSYLDLFSSALKQSARVTRVSLIPDLLISKTPSFTAIREAAVRLQADAVLVYAISSDIYSKYKLFARPDIKAFATTQVLLLDVRTGLVPFSTVVTKDYLSQKGKQDLETAETRSRVQTEAVLLTINETGQKLTEFLKTN